MTIQCSSQYLSHGSIYQSDLYLSCIKLPSFLMYHSIPAISAYYVQSSVACDWIGNGSENQNPPAVTQVLGLPDAIQTPFLGWQQWWVGGFYVGNWSASWSHELESLFPNSEMLVSAELLQTPGNYITYPRLSRHFKEWMIDRTSPLKGGICELVPWCSLEGKHVDLESTWIDMVSFSLLAGSKLCLGSLRQGPRGWTGVQIPARIG